MAFARINPIRAMSRFLIAMRARALSARLIVIVPQRESSARSRRLGLAAGFDDPYPAVSYALLIAIPNRVWMVA